MACSNLANCYEQGHGVGAKNFKEARRLYALASTRGYAEATESLAQLDGMIRLMCPLLAEERVIITGTRRGDLNGKAGVATNFDFDRGRYVVAIDGVGEMKIKPTNLLTVAQAVAQRRQAQKLQA